MDERATAVWAKCLQIIKDNIPAQSFITWFQPIMPLSVIDNELILESPALHIAEWIKEHYEGLITKCVRKELGREATWNMLVTENPDQLSQIDRKQLKAFVSSTFTDLVEERQAVINTLLRLAVMPVGWEMFNASDLTQLNLIKREIDDCEIYIQIIGHRYGSIDKKTKKSFTELEYEYAEKRSRQGKIKLLSFIRDRHTPIEISKIENDPFNIKKLQDFIKKITNYKATVAYWKGVDDLTLRVSQSVLYLMQDLKDNERKPQPAIANISVAEFVLPNYLPEGNHKATPDQLEFEYDIDALANVIALKAVTPPLAIGLFGNWGTGKSFFMQKIEEKVDQLTQDKKQQVYIKNIVHVPFNSWHYSDTNLWASLITQIFESLNDYATKKAYGGDLVNQLFQNLSITSFQIELAQEKIDENQQELKHLEKQKAAIENTIQAKKDKLDLWKTGDLFKIILSNPEVKADFELLKAEFRNEELIDNIQEVDRKLAEVDTFTVRIFKSFQLLRKNAKGKWLLVWLTMIILAVGVYLAAGPLKSYIAGQVQRLGCIVSGILLALYPLNALKPYFQKVNWFYRRLRSLKHTMDVEKEKVRLTLHEDVQKLDKEVSKLQDIEAAYAKDVAQKTAVKNKLNTEIEQIRNGKLIFTFLSEKNTDDNYLKQLGIISWIRKDFAKLNDLFIQQQHLQNKTKDEADESGHLQIDRILLYIDDLDRCSADVVLKVLEAIHLLLAFPLFVVIVGVDPRWLSNALNERFIHLLQKDGATSFDYLEKIFQIPFSLKPITQNGREQLISYLLKDEIAADNPNDINDPGSPARNYELRNEAFAYVGGPEDKVAEDEDSESAAARLTFTTTEVLVIKKAAAFFGTNPRRINRFLNIYRILKAHRNFQKPSHDSISHYLPVIITLSIVVSDMAHSQQFIDALKQHPTPDVSFDQFMVNCDLPGELIQNLKTFGDIAELKISDFIPNIDLIARFSFGVLKTA